MNFTVAKEAVSKIKIVAVSLLDELTKATENSGIFDAVERVSPTQLSIKFMGLSLLVRVELMLAKPNLGTVVTYVINQKGEVEDANRLITHFFDQLGNIRVDSENAFPELKTDSAGHYVSDIYKTIVTRPIVLFP